MQLRPSKRTIDRVAHGGAGSTSGGGAAKGMEFVAVILVFFGFGWLLDSAFGTGPWIAIAFLVLAVIGQFARVWYAYDEEMRGHEARLREGRRG